MGAGPCADLLLYRPCKAASCLAGHFLWCGERTRQLDAAHVEFMRGIGNPIGVKVSDKMDPNDLVTMIHAFNPENTPGRLAVIVRMGQEKLRAKLPALVSAVERAGQTVTWICDPMHGNTESCGTYKTRRWVHHPLSSDAATLQQSHMMVTHRAMVLHNGTSNTLVLMLIDCNIGEFAVPLFKTMALWLCSKLPLLHAAFVVCRPRMAFVICSNLLSTVTTSCDVFELCTAGAQPLYTVHCPFVPKGQQAKVYHEYKHKKQVPL